jgi:hypothetical protein
MTVLLIDLIWWQTSPCVWTWAVFSSFKLGVLRVLVPPEESVADARDTPLFSRCHIYSLSVKSRDNDAYITSYHTAYKCGATEQIFLYIFESPAAWKMPFEGSEYYKKK